MSHCSTFTFSFVHLSSEICKRSTAAEQAKMRAVVSDYKAKKRQKAAASSDGAVSAPDASTPFKRAPGGFIVGEQGKQILEDYEATHHSKDQKKVGLDSSTRR